MPIYMTELETSFSDGRVVNDWQEAGRVGHDGPVKQCLVVVQKIDEVDVAIEVGRLVTQLLQNSSQLDIFGFGYVWHKADDSECPFFSFGKGRRLVEGGVLKQSYSTVGTHCVSLFHVFVHRCDCVGAEDGSSIPLASATYGWIIFAGSTSRSNSSSVTNPSLSAACLRVRSLSSAWCAIFEALS